MYIIADFEDQIMREIDSVSRNMLVKPINLAPPGGHIGQLPQDWVEFDPIESTSSGIPASGYSLINNLNRIRGGFALGDGSILPRHLASGIQADITVTDEDGTPAYPNTQTIRFGDAELTQIDPNTVLVQFPSITLSGFATTGSGFVTRSWYIEGTVVSGLSIPDRLYYLPNGAVTRKTVSVSPYPGNQDLDFTIIHSLDGETWSDLQTITHPSGIVYHEETFIQTIPSGSLVGFRIDTAPEIPSEIPFSDITVILETREVGGTGGGGSLPEFTPKRIPFADNTTGILTESDKFNYITQNSSDFLVIGSDTALTIGGSPNKVGLALVRDNADGGMILETYSSGTYAPSIIAYRGRGTAASPEPVLQNDVLFRFTGRGRAETGWGVVPSFRLQGVANEDWTDSAYGTRAVISVTPNGEQDAVEMLQITGDGAVVYGDIEANATLIGTNLRVTDSPISGYVLTAVDLLGNAEWRPTSASGILTFDKYDPDLANSASSFNDEFSDDSLNVKWTTLSYDSSFDLSQAADGNRHLSESLRHNYLTLQGNWGVRTGIYQSFVPSDDSWTLVCKLTAGYVPESDNSYFNFGITTSGNTAFYEARVGYYGFNGIRVIYDDGGGALEATNKGLPISGPVYVSIVKEYVNPNTFYSIYMSHDGLTWLPIDLDRQFTNLTTATLYAQYFGVENQIIDGISSIDFIRYFGGLPHTFQIGSNP